MIEDLFRLLARPEVPWLLSAAIVVAAALVWGTFRSRLAPVLDALDRAIAAVEETDGPAGFRNRYPALSKTLADNPVLGEAWRAFAVTLEPAPRGGEALGYTRRPQEHFDDRLLLASGFNLRIYQAVPNLLVGLGLLFTFVGLVAALHFASGGVRSADVAVAQAALGDLLAAATFKFATSIAGLGSSILFSWREKAQLHRVQARILRFCHALEARTVPITAESVALAQLEELRQQSGDLQRMARDRIGELPEVVVQAARDEVRAAFEPLRTALAGLSRRIGEDAGWLVEAARVEPRGTQRRAAAPGIVEVTGARDGAAALLQELREIRRGIERLGSGDGRGAAGEPPPQSQPAGGRAGLAPRAERLQGRLDRLLELLRTVHRRLTTASADARLRDELQPILRELYGRLQEGAQAVRRLRADLATTAAGGSCGGPEALAQLEAGLDDARRRLETTVRELAGPSGTSRSEP